MNRYGQAAKVAFDPDVVLQYIEHLDRRELRSYAYDDGVHGRTVRRWKNPRTKGVTEHGLRTVLYGYRGQQLSGFLDWCDANDLQPYLRQRRPAAAIL